MDEFVMIRLRLNGWRVGLARDSFGVIGGPGYYLPNGLL